MAWDGNAVAVWLALTLSHAGTNIDDDAAELDQAIQGKKLTAFHGADDFIVYHSFSTFSQWLCGLACALYFVSWIPNMFISLSAVGFAPGSPIAVFSFFFLSLALSLFLFIGIAKCPKRFFFGFPLLEKHHR